MQFEIRGIQESDLDAVLGVQEQCYRRDLLESRECFAQKLSLFPRGCFCAIAGGRMVAYVFTHPWKLGAHVHLNSQSMVGAERPDCLYVHDMAIVPRARARGVADGLLRAVQGAADELGLGAFAGVAVQGSEPFWERWGFVRRDAMSYGAGGAHYMELRGRLCTV